MILQAPQRIETTCSNDPLEAIRRWPADRPLAAICSGPGARWTVLAQPVRTLRMRAAEGRVTPPVTRCGASTWPLATGWMGMISYGAGRVIEPRGGWRVVDEAAPLAIWHRCEGALVHDRVSGTWRTVGDASTVPEGTGREPTASAGELRPIDGRDRYMEKVARAIEYIRAGDIYQANISHRLVTSFDGSARAMFVELMRVSGAWHGAYMEWDDAEGRHAVLSASPELFLRVDGASGEVVTRPMKGTLPASAGSDALLLSDKDRAELHMIVDLMRNDLGRVCRFGSVRVADARTIERHGALHQGVATVTGVLREGCDLEGLLRATFPGGSITGAPKVRAMQVIDELEGFDRGAFCGCMGAIGDDGSAHLNVAIRTASLHGRATPGSCDVMSAGTLVYPVGAGIVADSDPASEWDETMQKASVLRGTIARLRGEA